MQKFTFSVLNLNFWCIYTHTKWTIAFKFTLFIHNIIIDVVHSKYTNSSTLFKYISTFLIILNINVIQIHLYHIASNGTTLWVYACECVCVSVCGTPNINIIKVNFWRKKCVHITNKTHTRKLIKLLAHICTQTLTTE